VDALAHCKVFSLEDGKYGWHNVLGFSPSIHGAFQVPISDSDGGGRLEEIFALYHKGDHYQSMPYMGASIVALLARIDYRIYSVLTKHV
jgi:hypothetical protein